jgi:heparin/heparan-sulfate lyase
VIGEAGMKRRDFVAGLLGSTLARGAPANRRPRLLITEQDALTGLSLLKSRYAAGARPSNDLPGWALSWLLTQQDSFAERALAEMRASHPPVGGRASRTWIDYVRWSLAFDWLYVFAGFDSALKDRIAGELADAAVGMLASPDLSNPGQVSYHNYSVRYLAFAAFPLAAVAGHGDLDRRCDRLRGQYERALENVLDLTDFVTPGGSYHESLDYMRITWASLVLMAELQRTSTGVDPAESHLLFRNIGATYLYKVLPDGTASRENDQEWPALDSRDTALLGYAVNRFKDRYSAWILRKSRFCVQEWILPVLEFLWNDPEVIPHDPALATKSELPRQRYFPGVGQLVMRSGWKRDSTWIEFDCGPYFAKHQHVDQNQFTIYHSGYLAIDSGADYTEIESPHYLNYYRRTVAHNSVLVYDPTEKFFWGESRLAAANDGGQRMDSSRYWNTVRSRADFDRTRDLWDIGAMRTIHYEPGSYHYALGDATNAYSRKKLRRFTRELVYWPAQDLLFVFDRVVSTDPAFHKAWLLHGVNEPVVDSKSRTFRFHDGNGELLVHSLLPREHTVTSRGGAGNEFFTPSNDHGGEWGSGENWPLDPAGGGSLPAEPRLRQMWKIFYGDNISALEKSNRKNVVPGAWRIEVSPAKAAEEDLFLHVMEIGDRGTTGRRRVEFVDGINFTGAAVQGGPAILFGTAGPAIAEGEVALPSFGGEALLITSLQPDSAYEVNGRRVTSNGKGTVRMDPIPQGRVRIALVQSRK